MKKTLLLLLTVILLGGCVSSSKLMQKGQYEAAVQKSVKKLRKNPENEKEIAVLERAYTIANERDLEQIRFLEREGNPRNMESIVQGYSRLRNRQSLVRTVLPLYLGDRVIQYPYVDYDEKIITARQQASEFFYNNALELLKRGDKESYRQAWNEFYKVKEYGGLIPGLDSLMEQARYNGISRALVTIQNHSPLNLPDEYIDQLLTVDPKLDNDWVEFYYQDLDKSIYFDYFLVVNLRAIEVTPDRVSEEDRMVRKRVEDGFEYVLDENGNVKKDSLGNDIKTTKYKMLACTVIETLQQKDVKIEGDLEILSENPRRMIKREPLVASGSFEHYSARAVGDLDALDEETRERVESQKMPFPTDVEMVMRTSDLFRQAIASAIHRNRQYIR
ncbi:MAG: hypothetical protein R6U64_08240 [Bacteroidales bacterium]